MNSIKFELQERKKEADTLLQLIQEMVGQFGSVQRCSILKSSFVVLLYNSMEAIVTLTLERIHEAASDVPYCDLAATMQDLWWEYILASKAPSKKEIEDTLNGTRKFPSIFIYGKRLALYSGNIDGRLLQKLMVKYGIGVLRTADRDKLLVIKNKRNKIAHGEETFKAACRNFTIEELKEFQCACFSALISLIDQAQDFLKEKKYILINS